MAEPPEIYEGTLKVRIRAHSAEAAQERLQEVLEDGMIDVLRPTVDHVEKVDDNGD